MLDVAVIGAGPYGLAVAAHLAGGGIDFRVFGEPMMLWERHMPPQMLLKSAGCASSISAPGAGYRLEHFAARHGLPYDDTQLPVPRETFAAYGLEFQNRLVPGVEPRRLVALRAEHGAYHLRFDDGELVTARRVVLAIGNLPFKYTPTRLSHFPAHLVSHSSDWGSLDSLQGKNVVILGAGASALDLAAELYDQGTQVTLLARSNSLAFITPLSPNRNILKRLYRPDSPIGPGWDLRLYADWPNLFHLMPEQWRLRKVRTVLGPLGSSWLREKIMERVSLKLGATIEHAERRKDRLHLRISGPNGTDETIETDHLVAATGYKVDLRQLSFLDDRLRARIAMVEHAPILSPNFEASAGLYFAGLTAANSFGPLLRFVHGTHFAAPRLVAHLSKQLVRRSVPVRQPVASAAG